VGAAKVILSMPKRSLELIDFSAFVPRARFHSALDCICQPEVLTLKAPKSFILLE
jgi:hypothetical protein